VHPLNVSFRPGDLAQFIENSIDPILSEWDVVIPQGAAGAFPITKNISIRLQQRKLEIDSVRRSILVNEKKMRVGSRGVEKEGMSAFQIEAAEREFRSQAENSVKNNVPDYAYRMFRKRPLLILHFLEGTVNGEKYELPDDIALTALGLSFPRMGGQSKSVSYRINLVEIRNMLAEENQEGEEEDVDEDEN
jgi:hypothetical protein